MNRFDANENPARVTVWWTPACGHQHVEDNPVVITWCCPDGFTGYDDEGEE